MRWLSLAGGLTLSTHRDDGQDQRDDSDRNKQNCLCSSIHVGAPCYSFFFPNSPPHRGGVDATSTKYREASLKRSGRGGRSQAVFQTHFETVGLSAPRHPSSRLASKVPALATPCALGAS